MGLELYTQKPLIVDNTAMNITDPEYLIESSDEKWQILQEARDYLHAYLHYPSSRLYSEAGVVRFDANEWGSVIDGGCTVCLAGLWYLKKENVLLGDMMKWCLLPQIADFLDDLRCLNEERDRGAIEDWIGIDVPDGLGTELATNTTGSQLWDGDNPYHILAFLNWLIERRPAHTL